jgi:hypothetical protein
MGRMRSALRAYVLQTPDPAAALRLLDRKIQYFEPDAMATVLYGLYSQETGEFVRTSGECPGTRRHSRSRAQPALWPPGALSAESSRAA